jgi:hypothetical protein
MHGNGNFNFTWYGLVLACTGPKRPKYLVLTANRGGFRGAEYYGFDLCAVTAFTSVYRRGLLWEISRVLLVLAVTLVFMPSVIC